MTQRPQLGDCCRCFDQTPAVEVEQLTFGQGTYKLALCRTHGELFRRDMYGWSRCGTIVDEIGLPSRPKEQRGVVVASHAPVPAAKAPEPEPEPPPKPTESAIHLRPGVNGVPWTFTAHALTKELARGVSRQAALDCIAHPQVTRPGSRPGTVTYTRGDVQVVVDPRQLRIVTVINRALRDEGV